jgi:hypothetical protein
MSAIRCFKIFQAATASLGKVASRPAPDKPGVESHALAFVEKFTTVQH